MGPISTEYLQELAARKSKAYELLLALEENPHADDSCFQSLAQIVDRIQFYEISLDSAALDGLRGYVKSGTQELESTLAVLALALSEAEPDRGCIHMLLEGYPKWLRSVSAAARPHLLGILPDIAVLLKDLNESGIDTLIACLNACASNEPARTTEPDSAEHFPASGRVEGRAGPVRASAEDCEIVSRCVDRYRETSASILIAAVEIANVAIRTNSRALVEKLMAAVAPEAMLDSKPSRELLPALAKLKTAAASESVWAAAIGVCVAVAKDNHSSALNLARHLEGSLSSLPVEMQRPYLNSFQRMIEEAGVALVGYGTKQLPVLFQKAGEARATEFVAQGIAIAHRYGRVAAEEFFELRTAAAKLASTTQASPLG